MSLNRLTTGLEDEPLPPEHGKVWGTVQNVLNAVGGVRQKSPLPKTKGEVYQRIQMKKQRGTKITQNEAKFEQEYLGINNEVKSFDELKPDDKMKVRNLAKEMVKNDYGQRYQQMTLNGVAGNNPSPNDYQISEEEIVKTLPRATSFLYPNLSQSNILKEEKPATMEADIQIPDNISNVRDALDHLKKTYKMNEQEARDWLKPRISK